MVKSSSALALAGALAVTACAQAPTSPSVLALPGANKPFAQFQQEDAQCRAYGQQATAGQAEAANQRAVGAALLGTAIGAAGGAIIGAPFRNGAGAGAGIGAGAGLLTGTSIGTSQSDAANYTIQQRFDIAYTQCMYANGNSVQSPPSGFAPPVAAAPGYGYGGYPYRPY